MSSSRAFPHDDRQAVERRLRFALRLTEEALAMRFSLPRGEERVEWALIAEACRREAKRVRNALGRMTRSAA